jgi:hypothetical protein
MFLKAWRASSAALALMLGTPTVSHAAPVITTVNANLLTNQYSFSFLGGSFTFAGMNNFPNYLAVSTGITSGAPAGTTAAVSTVAGGPSTDFTDRGIVVYDQNTLGGFGSFPALTTVPFTNGDNFLGLRVTSGGQTYFGFAFTTNATLNSFGFETTPNTGIMATTALTAVPEPATWAMMIGGFGLIGSTMRRRKRLSVRFA